jgi:hypothetical protein
MSSSVGNTQSPFVDVKSFTAEEEMPPAEQPAFSQNLTSASTPFVSIYELEEEGGLVDPRAEEYVAFLSELYDEEFDESVFELVNEAAALYEEYLTRSFEDEFTRDLGAVRFLEGHSEPLAGELERMLGALAERFGQTQGSALNESELEDFFDQYRPGIELSPSFENFFGKIWKGVKKVAKKAASVAGNLALGPIFSKLKALLRPLLKQVLRRAIGRLPATLQPVAQKLAERLGLLKELEEDVRDFEDISTTGVSPIQHQFNQQVADLLFATSEAQQDLEVSRAVMESQAPLDNPLAELDRARDEFISELGRLKEGEDPTPLLENFIPALLPALKVGLKLAGRKRVVNFLAQFLAKLIIRFVGPQYAPALSRAIVDAGLKLIGLEVTPQDEAQAAGTAVAATVEDTVRRVAALPEYILDNQELLEAFTLEAFEQAAAANLPPVLSEEAYQKRPELREAKFVRGTWVSLPLRGKKRYKKFGRILRARIAPQKAQSVESFGGVSLVDFMEEQLGMSPGSDVEAEVHLYESIPGTLLPELTRLETNTPGLGDNTEAAYGQLHPLTPEAAGMLLGEPGLGRPLNSPNLASRYATQPGQRFYYLSIPGAKPILPADIKRPGRMRRSSGVKVIFNFPTGQIRICMYLGEVRAQRMAIKLRQQAHLGKALTSLRALLERGMVYALRGGGYGRLKIIHETVAPEQALGGALQRIPAAVLDNLRFRLQEWSLKGLADFLKQQPQQFIAATEAPADGVTLRVTLANPPGIELLRQALKGRTPSLTGLKSSGPVPGAVRIDIVAGYSNG